MRDHRPEITTQRHCVPKFSVFRVVSRVDWIVGLVVHYFLHVERAKQRAPRVRNLEKPPVHPRGGMHP